MTLCAVLCLVTQSCLIPCGPMDCGLPGSSVHGDSPGKNSGVGFHALLQGIFPTQESNSALPHCRQILYQLSYQGSPQLTENTASPSHALSVRCPKGLLSCDDCILADDTLDLLYCSCFLLDIFIFWPGHTVCKILVEPWATAVKAPSPDGWIAREFPTRHQIGRAHV